MVKSEHTVLFTLQWLRNQNFIPVPLEYRSKAIAIQNWSYATSSPTDDLWYEKQLNIGVITGPKRQGPIDIDLDSTEAIFLAPYFLPSHAVIFGRKSKPASHYLYKTDCLNFEIIKVEDTTPKALRHEKDNLTFLEMRGDKHQTMLPGSIHDKSGEMIEWQMNPESLTTVDFVTLKKQFNLLAACCIAARHIWLAGQRHESVLQIAGIMQRLNYTQEECENFIKALIRYSGSDDPAHIATIRSTYAKAQSNRPSKGAQSLIRRFKDSNIAIAKQFLQILGYQDAFIDEYNEKFASVLLNGKYKVAILPTKPGLAVTYTSIDDFHHMQNGDNIYIGDKDDPTKIKTFSKSKLWAANPSRSKFTSVEFIPETDETKIDTNILNEFTGWPITPLDNPSQCAAFREYLECYVTDPKKPEQAQWVYTFFANIIKEPSNKRRAAMVIIGPQKIGKTLFINYFGKILGRYHINLADAGKIHGRFNAFLKTCLLLHSEEAIFGGDKKHKAIIKDMIANTQLGFEEKYQGITSGRNYSRLCYTSNEYRAAPLEAGDTRHTIFNFLQSKRLPPKTLVNKMFEETLNEGPAALMHYLLNYNLYNADLLDGAIQTEEKIDSLVKNLESVDEYFLEKLTKGELLPYALRWAQRPVADYNNRNSIKVLWPQVVSRYALYNDYLHYMRTIKAGTPLSSYAFLKELQNWLGVKFIFRMLDHTNTITDDFNAPLAFRELHSGQHQTICNFPSLIECRRAFELKLGANIQWEKPSSDLEEIKEQELY